MFRERRSRKLPGTFYNTISLFGVIVACASFGAILLLILIDVLVEESTPYIGIVTYLILPVILIFGLTLMPLGMWREHRRRLSGKKIASLPYVDMNIAQHRHAFILFTVIVSIFLILSTVVGYQTFKFTESVTFCGKMCHQVMEPELTTYLHSPHARVKCVECHVGSGAGWYLQSKLSGVYQLYSVLFNKYPKPILTPISNLRPARETCEHCHWPQAFFGSKQINRVHFMKDEENTRVFYNLLVKIGGGTPELGHTSGIHWHMNLSNKIEYLPSDKSRRVIPWVRSTNAKGEVTVYTSDPSLTEEATADPSKIRRMDCMDCHNRPTHKFYSPNMALNEVLNFKQIDPTLPFIKSISVDALDVEYPTIEEALVKIDSTIRDFYKTEYPDLMNQKQQQIEKAIGHVQNIYRNNNFPHMKSSWRTYPDNIGHLQSTGCFRCHDGLHKSPSGKIITKDCNACHVIIEQANGTTMHETNLEGLEFKHPIDIDNAWKEMNCSECHGLVSDTDK